MRRSDEGLRACSRPKPGAPTEIGPQLDFGPWEQIFYGEFDGNRPKRVLVKVIGE